MASLTDTYRIMQGQEPVNKERVNEEDETKIKMSNINPDGKPITQKFINDMKRIRNGETLVVEQVLTTKESVNKSIMDILLNGKQKEEE